MAKIHAIDHTLSYFEYIPDELQFKLWYYWVRWWRVVFFSQQQKLRVKKKSLFICSKQKIDTYPSHFWSGMKYQLIWDDHESFFSTALEFEWFIYMCIFSVSVALYCRCIAGIALVNYSIKARNNRWIAFTREMKCNCSAMPDNEGIRHII